MSDKKEDLALELAATLVGIQGNLLKHVADIGALERLVVFLLASHFSHCGDLQGEVNKIVEKFGKEEDISGMRTRELINLALQATSKKET